MLRFDEYMRVALYGEDGFYNSGGRAGRRGGHFLTSPEVGPLFGAVLAQAIDGWWRQLGEPADFTVIDVGAGPGTLARAILAAEPACAPRYVAVETSAAQRADHPDGVDSRAELPQPGGPGVVIANELLDNLPFRLAVFDGGWREAFVVDRRRCAARGAGRRRSIPSRRGCRRSRRTVRGPRSRTTPQRGYAGRPV